MRLDSIQCKAIFLNLVKLNAPNIIPQNTNEHFRLLNNLLNKTFED